MFSDRNHLIENRHIRLFLSSTFQDLQDERDYLMRRTFPELRKIAAERDVTLTELDLRWGITEEEAQSGKVVEICLREIENSIPFFIGIIGNRYGWCPSVKDIDRGTYDRFEQVESYVERHLSVTEMEMQFGVLERPENMNAFFYLSQQEIAIEDVDDPQRLSLLKETIKNNGRYPVAYFESKEDLANQIRIEFLRLLDKLYPNRKLTEIEKICIGQRSFMRQLCQTYIPNRRDFELLNNWLYDKNEHYLVVTGESGIGKSSLLANWIKEITNTDYTFFEIVCVFIGNGGNDGNSHQIQTIIIDEIEKKYGLADEMKTSYSSTIKDNKIERLFSLVNQKNHKPLLIVLDAINQLSEENNAKPIQWIPKATGKIKILFSTLPDDVTMTVFESRNYPVFHLQALDRNHRMFAIQEYLGLFSKRLNSTQLERLADFPLCKNTLILRLFLDELISFGVYEHLDERINLYLESNNKEEFYKILLNSYEMEYGREFVEMVLCIIAISRKGLSENEIIRISGVSPLIWSQFYCAFRKSFTLSNGLVYFSHATIVSIIENKYLKTETDKTKYRNILLDWFLKEYGERSLCEIPYQLLKLNEHDSLYEFLSRLDVFSYLFSNDRDFLRKYWNKLLSINNKYTLDVYLNVSAKNIDKQSLSTVLINLGYFANDYFAKYELALRFYQHSITELGDCINNEVATIHNNMATTYMNMGDYVQAINHYKKALDIRTKLFGDLNIDVATTYNNIGVAYAEINTEESLRCHKISLEIRKRLYGEHHSDVAISYANICSVLFNMGKYEEAQTYIKKAIKIQKELSGELNENLAIYYGDYALSCCYLKENKEAELFYNKALSMFEDLYIYRHPYFASCYSGLGGLYSSCCLYEKSIFYYKKALDIYSDLYTEQHHIVANIYNLLSTQYMDISDYNKAEFCIKKAYSIYKNISNNSEVWQLEFSNVCNNIGFFYYSISDYNKSISYYREAITITNKCSPDDKGSIAIEINNIARAYFKMGEIDTAFVEQEKALKMQLEIYGEKSVDVARSYNNIGLIYLAKNDYNRAYEYLSKGLNIRLSLVGDNRLDIADSNVNIGDYFYKKREYHDSINHYVVAYNYYVEIFGKQNVKSRDVYKKILKAKMKRLF